MFSCSTVNWRRKKRTKYLTEDNLNFFLLQEKINCKLNSPKLQGLISASGWKIARVHDFLGESRVGKKRGRETRREDRRRRVQRELHWTNSTVRFFFSRWEHVCPAVPCCRSANQAGQRSPEAASPMSTVAKPLSRFHYARTTTFPSCSNRFFHRYQYHERNIQNWKFSSDLRIYFCYTGEMTSSVKLFRKRNN